MSDKNQSTKKFTSDETAAFCEQIALILNGGISLYDGTYLLCQEDWNTTTRDILTKLNDKVSQNIPFHQALEETGAFPAYMVNMVRIGEVTGKLEDVMVSLSQYYGRDSRIKSRIKNVITYPCMLFGMMTAVLLVLVIKILPMFQQIFDELNADASVSSSNMMLAGLQAGKVIAVLVILVFVLLFIIIAGYGTDFGKKNILGMARKLFFTKKLTEQLALGKFVSSMSLMISSGMDTKEALALTEAVVDHPVIKGKINTCTELVSQGKPMEEVLKTTKIITGIQGSMILVGSKTGVLDMVFQKLSKQYDEDIESRLNGLASTIETLLIVVLSLIVGAILITVMLPLISIISSIG